MSPSPAEAKSQLRRSVRERLRALPVEQQAIFSAAICATVAALPEFTRARTLALFSPLPGEPDVRPVIEWAWREQRRVVLPLVQEAGTSRARLEWHALAGWEELSVIGPWGLREPDPARSLLVEAQEIDLVLVPGVAFDGAGLRLGRGGGYYDRFLAARAPQMKVVGAMFACQEVAAVPVEPHDEPLPGVITEKGLRRF